MSEVSSLYRRRHLASFVSCAILIASFFASSLAADCSTASPTVTLHLTPATENSPIIHLDTDYSYPDDNGAANHWIGMGLGPVGSAALIDAGNPQQASGTWPFSYDTTCAAPGAYTFQAAAIHCGNTDHGSHSNAETVTITYDSHADLTARYIGMESGQRQVKVDVTYVLPPHTNEWGITIYPQSWIGSDGQPHSIDSAGSGLSTRTGTWSHVRHRRGRCDDSGLLYHLPGSFWEPGAVRRR